LSSLAERFHPTYIEKKDKHFFLPAMEYFSKEGQDAALQECWEFDRKLIHEKYLQGVERCEKGK
jgi:hypothetical protein